MRIMGVAALLMLAGCNGGAGAAPAPVERNLALRDFTAVALTGPDRVDVRRGNVFAVRMSGDPKALEKLEIRRDGDTLRIGRKPNAGGWQWHKDGGVTVFVTMPDIRRATLKGSGDLAIDLADDLVATLAGSGDLTVGRLRGRSASLSLSGSGTIAAAGKVDRLALSVSGSGDIDAAQVKAAEAQVGITGSGDVTADVTGPASVALGGSGSVTLGKGARCAVSRTGSGEARCGG